MKDEIKEILKTMKTFNGNLIVENTEVTTLCLTKKESKLLLDYITNLQVYKSKNEEAIYYIWKEIEQEYDEENNKWLKERIDNLLNILQGSDKE